jgi:3-dehydroquinate synthase
MKPSLMIKTALQSYPLYIGPQLISDPSLLAEWIANKQVFILTDSDVAAVCLKTLIQTCTDADALLVDHYVVEAGEQAKSLESAQAIWSHLMSKAYNRSLVLITLGGGMIGDLGGFCASCYLRGIRLIHFPTTLLAQVDAAIGGKTGVNTPWGKNLIGTFYQPTAVMIDTNTLQSLNSRDYICGLAELIKYGLALNAPFYTWLIENMDKLLAKDTNTLCYAVLEACKIKAKIVLLDERDQSGQRALLNFGHTLAHALESMLDYKQIKHGEAVAIGMIFALHLSVQYIGLNPDVLTQLKELLTQVGLPTTMSSRLAKYELWTKMKHDKKHLQKLPWILLPSIGQASLNWEISEERFNTIFDNFVSIPG